MSSSALPKIVVVTGPTASGKSDLALFLAEKLGGEIVVLDSVQVYRGADIGSAKATVAEQGRVRHHLIDILDLHEQFDAGRFIECGRQAIAEIISRGAVPIVVGGTTFYLTSLLHGLSDEPKKSLELRAELETLSAEALWARLQDRDLPATQALHPNDRLRIIRAIERVELGGKGLVEMQQAHGHRGLFYHALLMAPLWERSLLQARIEARTKAMLRAGLAAEAQNLAALGASRGLCTAVGYRQVLAGARGDVLCEEVVTATRRYAKRQMTYLRNEPAKRGWNVKPESGSQNSRSLSQQYGSVRTDAKIDVLSLNKKELLNNTTIWLERKGAADAPPELWLLDGATLVTTS